MFRAMEDVEKALIELYEWYYKSFDEQFKKLEGLKGRKARKNAEYNLAKLDGGCEAVEALLLQTIGGKRFYALWLKQIEGNAGEEECESNSMKTNTNTP